MSSEVATVETVVEMPMDFTVIAQSPKEMEAAQRSLILWAARKIQALKQEIAGHKAELEKAIARKWDSSGWRREVSKAEKREHFYRKIKAALEAGYYIVPPFPVDVFAIRTKKEFPARMDSPYRNNHDQLPQVLPQGVGRYVDPRPRTDTYTEVERQKDGTTKEVRYVYAEEFRDVDFPFKLAKAEIREATEAAMKLKIFDTMGVLPRRRSPDPIVVGQIMVPNRTLWRNSDFNRAVTFFVAWWLDTKTL
jgi:hypothetical protein